VASNSKTAIGRAAGGRREQQERRPTHGAWRGALEACVIMNGETAVDCGGRDTIAETADERGTVHMFDVERLTQNLGLADSVS